MHSSIVFKGEPQIEQLNLIRVPGVVHEKPLEAGYIYTHGKIRLHQRAIFRTPWADSTVRRCVRLIFAKCGYDEKD